MRPSNRAPDQMREVKLTCNYTMHAEGSVLVEFGNTKVLCNASVDDRQNHIISTLLNIPCVRGIQMLRAILIVPIEGLSF